MEFSPSSECIDTQGFQDALSSIVCVCSSQLWIHGVWVCCWVGACVYACTYVCVCVCVYTVCVCVHELCGVCVCVLSKLHLHTTSQGHVDS